MNYKKAVCFLAILFCLPGNTNAIAITSIIDCEADQANQKFACLEDAVKKVKNHNGQIIYIVGYGSATLTRCTGRNIAASFRRQLIDAIRKQESDIDDSSVLIIDGGYRDDAWVEVFAGSSNEQPPITAKWPSKCR